MTKTRTPQKPITQQSPALTLDAVKKAQSFAYATTPITRDE